MQGGPAVGGVEAGGGKGIGKASASSPTFTRPTLETDWPAVLACDPGTAAHAKPFGSRGSFAACLTNKMPACA